MTLDERLLSFDLLRVMQNLELSAEARAEAYGRLLELNRGFWQREDAKNPQSLRGFTQTLAKKMIDRYGLQKHARMRAMTPDDLSQDILLYLHVNATAIRTNPRGYLIAVAVGMVRHYISRHAPTEFGKDFDAMTAQADEPGPGELPSDDAPHVVTFADIERFRELTKSLTPNEQQAMEYRYVEGLSDSGISVAMEKSESAARKTLSRGHKKLRKQLREKQTPPGDAPPANDAPPPDGPDEE
jgi:RNA polymerase sigma factor (sigma-70 family)